MVRGLILALTALVALPVWGQDDPKERKAKLNELGKQIRSRDEGTRLEAIDALGKIDDAKARSLLSKKLTTDSEKVRVAAAQALIRHKHPVCADALGNGIRANFKSDKMVGAYVGALSKMDMCAGIKVLLMVAQGKPKQGAAALDAVAAIGCPEAVQPLVNFLKTTETEEKKPDFFQQPAGVGTTPFNRNRFREGGKIPNKTKDKDLAKLAPKVRETLERLTSQKYADYKGWFDASRGGKLNRKLISVYRCPTEGKTFELATGKRVTCPYASGKSGHKDLLLKHRPE